MSAHAPAPVRKNPSPANDAADLGSIVQAVLRHTRFNLRQIQPAWLEACVSRHAADHGCNDKAEHLALLQRNRQAAEGLLQSALQPPPIPDDTQGATAHQGAGLRAGTRGLLDGVARGRPEQHPLDIWVLVPEGRAMLAHLREHMAMLGRAQTPLRIHGPQALRQQLEGPHPLALRPAAEVTAFGDVRQTLHWLDQHLTGDVQPAAQADLILASELFTCWRPDLQRQWLSRLAAILRPGGLLLLGRPKALWRAPRGMRAIHVDGLHWLQRSGSTVAAPAPSASVAAPAPPSAAAAPDAAPASAATTAAAAGDAADAARPALEASPLPSAIPATAATTTSAPPAPTPAAAQSPSEKPLVESAEPTRAALLGSGTAAQTPLQLRDTGMLWLDLGERRLVADSTTRRLAGWPESGPLGWQQLAAQLGDTDRASFETVLQLSLDTAAPLPLLLTLQPARPDGAPAPGGSTRLQLRGELVRDADGRQQLLGMVVPLPPEPDTAADGSSPLQVVTSLPGAVARRELELMYQPQFDVTQDRLIAVEALLRWRHPQHGLVEPDAFLPWAEECGLIIELGRWVLQQACRQARRWHDVGLSHVPVAVNVSPAQLRAPDFIAQVQQALAQAGVPPSALELEFTESALQQQPEIVRQQLSACRRLGVRVALDDFGASQTHLSRLHRLPLDKLKLDPSFVHHLSIDRGAQAVLRSMVGLGHQLGLTVVAEGVEQAQQLAVLGEARCDAYQGHHAAPALSAEELTRQFIAPLGA